MLVDGVLVGGAGLLVDADDYFRAFYRAAERAQRTISISGWQFDSDVCLLRGAEAEQAALPVTFKEFLNALCERSPELEIFSVDTELNASFETDDTEDALGVSIGRARLDLLGELRKKRVSRRRSAPPGSWRGPGSSARTTAHRPSRAGWWWSAGVRSKVRT